MTSNEPINYLDLFSGIGGFAYAATLANVPINHHSHFYSDVEEGCNNVYKKHFPTATALGDITQIDGKKLKAENPGKWFITGGFPCQDASTAGKRAGINGNRTGLWYHYARLIDDLRPQAILAENVQGILSAGLDRVLFSLAQLGYDAEWANISASSIGAPHQRKRIWIVAYPSAVADADMYGQSGNIAIPEKHTNVANDIEANDTIDRRSIEPERTGVFTDPKSNGRLRISESYQTSVGRNLADHYKLNCTNHRNSTWINWNDAAAKAQIVPDRLFLGVDDGLSVGLDLSYRLNQIKQLGNTIVPQVAATVMRKMQLAGLLPYRQPDIEVAGVTQELPALKLAA